jgi:hypothetical protein
LALLDNFKASRDMAEMALHYFDYLIEKAMIINNSSSFALSHVD